MIYGVAGGAGQRVLFPSADTFTNPVKLICIRLGIASGPVLASLRLARMQRLYVPELHEMVLGVGYVQA